MTLHHPTQELYLRFEELTRQCESTQSAKPALCAWAAINFGVLVKSLHEWLV